jgi:hypothetical protein
MSENKTPESISLSEFLNAARKELDNNITETTGKIVLAATLVAQAKLNKQINKFSEVVNSATTKNER